MFTLDEFITSFMTVYQSFDVLVFSIRPRRPVAFKLADQPRSYADHIEKDLYQFHFLICDNPLPSDIHVLNRSVQCQNVTWTRVLKELAYEIFGQGV